MRFPYNWRHRTEAPRTPHAIYLTKTGIPTGVISVATRYIHSPVEVLCISDIDKAADLMARCLETAGRYFKN